jgi:hypothetical protein
MAADEVICGEQINQRVKAKPVVKQGRKAMGLTEIARLPQ